MKRQLLVFLAFLLVLPVAVFAAGGQEASDDDVYEIIWYHGFGSQFSEETYDQFFGEMNAYLMDKIGVTLNFVMLDDYGTQINLIASSGEPWDLAFTASWLGEFGYRENARNGTFHPLNDLLQEHGQGLLDALNPAWFSGNTIDGDVYAIATQKELGNWPVNVLSKKIIDQYGIDPDKMGTLTYESFLPYVEQFKQDYPDDFPLWPEPIDGATRERRYLTWIDYALPFVMYVDQRDLKVRNQFEVPEQIAVYKEFKELIDAGYVHPDMPTLTSIGGRVINELSNGNFLVKNDLAFPGAGPALEARYRVPVYFTNTADPVVENGSVGGSMLAISANSERPDKVMQFVELLNTDDYVRNAFNWGIEGVHYEKIGANRIRQIPDSGWHLGQWTLQNFYILWVTEDQDEDLWSTQFAEFNDSATDSPALGFFQNYDSIRGEIDSIRNTMDEYRNFLFDNRSVDDSLALINDQLKRDGIDKVIAELQSQYDAWRASQ